MHDVSAIHLFYSFPPNPPNDRVQLLRRAFQETMNDAEFLAEAKKGNLDIGPVAGEDLEKIANSFFKVDPATVNKLRELLREGGKSFVVDS